MPLAKRALVAGACSVCVTVTGVTVACVTCHEPARARHSQFHCCCDNATCAGTRRKLQMQNTTLDDVWQQGTGTYLTRSSVFRIPYLYPYLVRNKVLSFIDNKIRADEYIPYRILPPSALCKGKRAA